MRDCKTITLSPDRDATVHELRVRDVRRVLSLFTNEELARPLPELIRDHLPSIIDLLGDCVSLPDGEAVDDLSVSECRLITDAWWELHKGFFLQAAALAAGMPNSYRATSTAPA